jgi:hypothetical protein
LLAVAALLASGCGGPAVKPLDTSMMPEMEATAMELIDGINARADSVLGIRADLDMGFIRSEGEEMKRCRGKLISIKEMGEGGRVKIYLKGYRRLMPTFFTLTSDGREFWLHIPSENTVYTGPFDRTEPADTAEIDLETVDLARALYIQPVDPSDLAGLSEDSGAYVLSLNRDGRLWRKIWIEKRIFAVVLDKYYTPLGGEELEVRRSEFALIDGTHYPLETVIIKPDSGREISLKMREVSLNPDGVPGAAFAFEVPGGANVKRLDQAHR